MHITFTTRDSRTHRIRLATADYCLPDLMGFNEFGFVYHCLFGGVVWLPAQWVYGWLNKLRFRLEMEKDVLPYRYGADGDFGGGQTVMIRGEAWSLDVGSGECSLSQGVAYVPPKGSCEMGSRITKWIDLRGQTQLEVDDGKSISLQRKKQEYRWYTELPGLLRFLATLGAEDEVRAWAVHAPVALRELIRIAEEEPGGMDAAVEILRDQGEKGKQKLSQARDHPRYAKRRAVILEILSLAEASGP